MDVIIISNGLGNQLFQYALYFARKQQNKHTFFIYVLTEGINQHNGYELGRAFNIESKNRLIQRVLLYLFNARRKRSLWGKLIRHITKIVDENDEFDYKETLFRKRKGLIVYYRGGWPSEKYFIHYKEILRNNLIYNDKLLSLNALRWKNKIINTENSVSVHVRRGDYLNFWQWQGIADEDYYDKAIRYLKNKYNSLTFYVFSDDIAWCKSKWMDKSFVFVDSNVGADSWQDLFLQSLCKHHINANSTFSWWGAWLTNKIGEVIVPAMFRNDKVMKDIYPSNWIKINK